MKKNRNNHKLNIPSIVGKIIMDITNFFHDENHDYTSNVFYNDTIKNICKMWKEILGVWLKKSMKLLLYATLVIGILVSIIVPDITVITSLKIVLGIFGLSLIVTIPDSLKEFPIFSELKDTMESLNMVDEKKSKVKKQVKHERKKEVPSIEEEVKKEADILNDLLGIWLLLPKDSTDYLKIKNNVDALQEIRKKMKNHEEVNMAHLDLIWQNLTTLHEKYCSRSKSITRKRRKEENMGN